MIYTKIKGKSKMADKKYHINCSGCNKADKETLIGKEEDCRWCDGTGQIYTDEQGYITYGKGELCCDCDGNGKREYIPRASEHYWARNDSYGIYTGLYCNGCYDDSNIYTYRKDEYFDEAYVGERMESDY